MISSFMPKKHQNYRVESHIHAVYIVASMIQVFVWQEKKKKKAEDLGDSSSTPAAPTIKRQLKQFQANIPMYDVMERGKWQ